LVIRNELPISRVRKTGLSKRTAVDELSLRTEPLMVFGQEAIR
jgi:hypothetical protein